MNKLLLNKILFVLAILIAPFSYSQDFEFTAAISHNQVSTGDRFKIEFTANGEISNFKAPNLSNFRVLSGPNQSTSMSWVNGNMSASYTYSYILMAVKEGDFTIKPAIAAYKGDAYSTNTLNLKVTKGANVQAPAGNNNKSSNVTQKDLSDDIFIKSSVNKTKVYQGEQIIATYKLYTKVNIAANELVKNAELNGFWSQEVDLGQSQWSQEVIGGYRWNVATIRKIVLFPQRSGNLEIDPLVMKFIIQKRVQGGSNSVFDQFFGRVENYEQELKSKPIKITVLPNPENGKPENFTNAVGNLNMSASISTTNVKANEAINLKVKVSGKGNIPLIDEIPIEFPDDFETYDPKVNDNYKTTSSGVSGSREYDYLIIPRHEGTFTIPSVSFSYFNPSSKKYETINSEPFTINVAKGDGSAGNVTYSGSDKEEVEIIGKDIRYIDLKGFTPKGGHDSFYGSIWFYLLLLLAPLTLVIGYFLRNKFRASKSDIAGTKRRKAGKIASKHLQSAKKSLDEGNKNEFYENIAKALFGYVGDKLSIPSSELNQDNIKEQLISLNIQEATSNQLLEVISTCDMARFAPVNVSEQEIYTQSENIINQIEKEAQS